MAKKTALVQPPPKKPASKSQLVFGELGEQLVFEEVLRQTGNDRAYTIIRRHGNTWRVHFAGDLVPSTVKLVNGKPVITRDS